MICSLRLRLSDLRGLGCGREPAVDPRDGEEPFDRARGRDEGEPAPDAARAFVCGDQFSDREGVQEFELARVDHEHGGAGGFGIAELVLEDVQVASVSSPESRSSMPSARGIDRICNRSRPPPPSDSRSVPNIRVSVAAPIPRIIGEVHHLYPVIQASTRPRRMA